MSEFRAYVTRIVGLVVADPRRRLATRQELLNHLDEVYAEEIKREPSEHLAVETSIQRLGNPEELIRELQLSVPFRDIVARALRWATVSLVLQCILFLPLSAIATLDSFVVPGERNAAFSNPASVRFLLTVLVSAQVVIALVVFVLTLLHFWRQRATRLHGHPFLVSFVCVTATGLTILASGAFLHLVITGGMFFSVSYCIRWSVIAIVVALLSSVLPKLLDSQYGRFGKWREWASLESESRTMMLTEHVE